MKINIPLDKSMEVRSASSAKRRCESVLHGRCGRTYILISDTMASKRQKKIISDISFGAITTHWCLSGDWLVYNVNANKSAWSFPIGYHQSTLTSLRKSAVNWQQGSARHPLGVNHYISGEEGGGEVILSVFDSFSLRFVLQKFFLLKKTTSSRSFIVAGYFSPASWFCRMLFFAFTTAPFSVTHRVYNTILRNSPIYIMFRRMIGVRTRCMC